MHIKNYSWRNRLEGPKNSVIQMTSPAEKNTRKKKLDQTLDYIPKHGQVVLIPCPAQRNILISTYRVTQLKIGTSLNPFFRNYHTPKARQK